MCLLCSFISISNSKLILFVSFYQELRENYLFNCCCPKCEEQKDDPDVTSDEEDDDDDNEDMDED